MEGGRFGMILIPAKCRLLLFSPFLALSGVVCASEEKIRLTILES
jgi:hypothetical protein